MPTLALASLMISCIGPERSNPLDGTSIELFVPQITRPNGGEFWFTETRQKIRSSPATEVPDSVVTIQLICAGSSTTIAAGIPNTGLFLWDVPETVSSNCRVRISGSVGYSESNSFRILPAPILTRVEIGGSGRHPAALREQILFTSDRQGTDDIWLFDRRSDTLDRLTTDPGVEDEADFFKPNGTVFAFTSDRSGQGPDIWMMAMEGPTAFTPIRVTTDGGRQSVWQPSFFSYPALAYRRPEDDTFGRSHIFSTSLMIRTSQIIPLPNPVPVFPEIQITTSSALQQSLSRIDTITWGNPGGGNVILYQTGDVTSLFWRLDIPLDENFMVDDRIRPTKYQIPEGFVPQHPAITTSGSRVAFSNSGDIWIVPLNDSGATQLTSGPWEDDFPDWASETKIVFQRRTDTGAPWEIWALQVPEL